MSRRRTHDQIEAVYAEAGADVAQIRRLRARILELHDEVGDHEEQDVIAEATDKAFELVHILLDEGLLKTRHLGPDAADRTRLLAIVGANVDYLQAAVAAFSP